MYKFIVHYSKEQRVELNVGCLPTSNEEFLEFCESVFQSLQADINPEFTERYGHIRSMMVGDIVQSPFASAACEPRGFQIIPKEEIKMLLDLDSRDRIMGLNWVKKIISKN
jgi:hypothetical protein